MHFHVDIYMAALYHFNPYSLVDPPLVSITIHSVCLVYTWV